MFALCGHSGSGKTTLLEAVIPMLSRRGLAVAVLKHDVHGIELDRAGKDSDRLFRAGADVVLHTPTEAFVRRHRPLQGVDDETDANDPGLEEALTALLADHDLVLVEGHKGTSLPKMWLCRDGESGPPRGVSELDCVLPWGGDRADRAVEVISRFLADAWSCREVYGGVLIGGRSERMKRPKQLLDMAGRTFLEMVVGAIDGHVERVVLIGAGPVPGSLQDAHRLPDIPGLQGPAAGLVAALRWQPHAAWLIVACDQPLIRPEAVDWLLRQRTPGRWALMPRPGGGVVEPFLAVYEPQSLSLFDRRSDGPDVAPRAISNHHKVECPTPPAELAECWRSVNTPDAYEAIAKSRVS